MVSAVLILVGAGIAMACRCAAGSIAGGLVASAGAIPAGWSAWAAMQKETQGPLAMALAMVFVSLGVGALLIVLWIIGWIRS